MWQADYGTFDAAGKYTTPSYVPVHGIDVLRYVSPNGTVTATVRVAPLNADTPTPTKVFFDLAPPSSPLWNDPAYMSSLRAAIAGKTKPYVIVSPGYDETEVEVEDCEDVADTAEGLNLVGYDASKQPVAVPVTSPSAATTDGSGSLRSATWPFPRQRCRPKPGHQSPAGYRAGPGFVTGKYSEDPPVYGTEPGPTVGVAISVES